MKRLNNSLRTQLIFLTIISLVVLAGALEITYLYQEQSVLVNSERRVGLTLIRSVNTTINSVRSFISTLSDISELDTRLSELVQLNENIEFIAVTDVEGNIIFHSSDEYQGRLISELSQLPIDETVSKNVPGFGNVLLTSLSFDSSDLREPDAFWIVVASPSDPLNRQLVNTALSSVLVTALFAVIVAFVIILFVQRYFVRPLEQLTKAANAIEAGDLGVQVTAKQNNEIGQVARSFNSMTQQLANSINTLEERVGERTLELETARDQAEQANRAKSDFLSNMSHELRTPLNMVIGYTSSMLNMPQMYNNMTLPEVYRKDIQLIRESGRHLLALINDVLDLSKVEAGKLQLNFTAVDLNMALDGAVAASLGLVGDKPLQLRQNYPENLPKVWGDTVRVRQILLNLLSNAIKFTETGSVTLTAKVQGTDVYIAVTDTGPGIPENALSTIFDRFEQYRNDSEIQGTGLGLDISQKLAQLHGSTITIETTTGLGSTFTFSLPLATVEQLAQPEDDLVVMENVQLFSGNADLDMTALLVATDIAIRQQLRKTLDTYKIALVEANDAERAFDLVTGLLPDFIVMDLDTEKLDYQMLLNNLENDPETQPIPVILLAGSVAPSIDPTSLARTVVTKPFIPEEIMRVIQTVCNAEAHQNGAVKANEYTVS